MTYTSEMSAEQQIDVEEKIATMIFDSTDDSITEEQYRVAEETAQELGREILMTVLQEFRPDLCDD